MQWENAFQLLNTAYGFIVIWGVALIALAAMAITMMVQGRWRSLAFSIFASLSAVVLVQIVGWGATLFGVERTLAMLVALLWGWPIAMVAVTFIVMTRVSD